MTEYHRARFLVLCFVLINQCPRTEEREYINVALGKPTQQTDVAFSSPSELAVDGNRDSIFHNRSCTHTKSHENTLFLVDLMHRYPINRIQISNRNVLWERLADFYIYVSDVDPRPIPPPDGIFTDELCVHYTGSIPTGGPHTLQCDSNHIRGRYVYVWKPGNGALTLCEFEVFASIDKGFYALPGIKMSSSPALTTRLQRFSTKDCIRLCVSVGGQSILWIQVEEKSKTCECINGFKHGESVLDGSWTVMKPFVYSDVSVLQPISET